MPVLLIVIDGLRPDALTAVRCPALDAIREQGAWTLQASSVMPTITLPCHMSIFHSVPPSRHGITTNEWIPMKHPLPGLIDVASTAGLRSAFFYGWEPMRNVSLPDSLFFSYYRYQDYHEPDGDQLLAEEASGYILRDSPDFAFVYFGTLDVFGHDYGYMSDQYLAQLERVDACVATLLHALPTNWTKLLLSDHGGHDRDHGTELPEDMIVPWMVAGPGIRRAYEIRTAVSILDTAPTIASILGITIHAVWEGKCVEEIFE